MRKWVPVSRWMVVLLLLTGLFWVAPSKASVESEMEIPADPSALAAFKQANAGKPFVVFTDDRLHSVRRNDIIPARWLDDPNTHLGVFTGTAQPGEFYVFQLAVWAHKSNLAKLEVVFTDLHDESGKPLPAKLFRCLSLGGIGPDGRPFKKDIGVPAGKLQVLWVGVEVPADASGKFIGNVSVSAAGAGAAEAKVILTVEGPVLADHGDRDAWRLSRLRWLDSTVGRDPANTPTRPFTPPAVKGRKTSLLGRDVIFGEQGLIAQVNSRFNTGNTAVIETATPLLSRPMRFVLVSGANEIESYGAFCINTMEFDGYISYRCRLEARDEMKLENLRLEIPFAPQSAAFMMGLGRQGGYRPESFDWKWDREKYQDAVWIGGVNAGLMLRLKARDYVRPLSDIYYHLRPLNLPRSWDNGGRGGISIRTTPEEVLLTAYTGPLSLKAGESIDLDFDLYLTPFKQLDPDQHWRDRFYHPFLGNVMNPVFVEPRLVTMKGANIVNAHHNTNFNPFINYPYNDLSFGEMQDYIRRAHQAGLKVKVYYTTREITNNMPEFWAMYSMNGEVIFPGPGNDIRNVIHPRGPDPWYLEHLGHDYIPAWRETIRGRYNVKDLAVITTPDTRWNNFYLEGLRYMVDHADLDGVYIDGTALGRDALQRARRILDGQVSGKPRRGIIDFHAGSSFNEMGCWASTAVIYMEIFPYLDRLWLGEGFDYEKMTPDQWLVEVSGIPFGLMSEMLGRGNPWRGMVFGMTNRLGWGGDPRGLWELFDDFGMEGSEMKGWWDPDCPVTTGDQMVPVTVYQKEGRALIALASWRDDPASVRLKIDWKALGLDPARARLRAPFIYKVQMPHRFKPDQPIPVEPGKGLILLVESR